MNKSLFSVRAKIILSFLLSIFLVVTGVFAYNVYKVGQELSNIEDEKQKLFVSGQSSKAFDLLITEDVNILVALAMDIKESSPDVVYCLFRGAEGEIVTHTFDDELPGPLKDVGYPAAQETREIRVAPYGMLKNITYPIDVYGSITVGFRETSLLDALKKEIGGFALVYAASMVIGLLISLLMAGRIVTPLKSLLTGIEAAGRGELMEVPVKSSDELGQIAGRFNETMNQLKESLQTDAERRSTQKNVMAFLEVVSQASEGDLTVKAPVTADVFGNIADAYNLMIDSLSDLMKGVRASANEVGQESKRLMGIFADMEQGAESQMTQVKQATAAVDETAATTHEISTKVTAAQDSSARMGQTAAQGRELVSQNTDGMQSIRVTVQSINKKMKTLSEHLLEIGTISNLISEVSSRTTILAMNASIEAARAGAQGKGFMVIADEIKGLADRATEATKQISTTIKTIQTEAGEVTASLEEETKIVEKQTSLANDTGEAFREIESAINDSRNVVQEIYDLSQGQRKLTNNVVLSIEEVSKISMKALSLVKNSVAISEGLNNTSVNLLSALKPFKLPEGGVLESPEADAASEFFSDSFNASLTSRGEPSEEFL